MAETADDRLEPPDSTCDVDCYCRLDGLMELLSRRYAMQLICVVGAIGPARYGEIEDAFDDVSSSTLSTRLDELVDADYLDREQYAEIPPRVEYDLTDDGDELCRRLQPLLEWAADRD
ncbi:helix-turn-helix domain-containing protein [Natrinema sp. CBA1119]|uniref:winged helix-turn-helix transcriptional regulator n=1 Tax=Natrinema sp. CBA1119 TaxID=1608465 RepID=UPI0020D27F00|nr:helix-turn-helix domain-containing protein [Natrinema sp. CBA1119]